MQRKRSRVAPTVVGALFVRLSRLGSLGGEGGEEDGAVFFGFGGAYAVDVLEGV